MGVSRSIRKQDKNKRGKDGEAKAAAPKKRKQKTEETSEKAANKRRLTGMILVLVFFVGLSVMLYPMVAAYVNSKHATKAVANYEATLKAMKPADYSAFFNAADNYNAAIREVKLPFQYYEEVPGYAETLNIDGSGIMGYISIDKIEVELPIYHFITPQVLSRAVGHIPGSSLPVGGESTHAVLSAHRGLPSATLFTHLDRLEVGDTFRLTILDRVLTYEIDQVHIVKPDEVDDLYIVPGEDFCTLVTCTPYGINTHRMLVRGKRIETVMPKPDVYVPNEAFIIDPLIVAPLVAMPMLFVLLIALMVKYSKRNKKPALEQAENIVEASENLKNTENPETAGNSEDIEKNPEKREEQGGKDEQNE